MDILGENNIDLVVFCGSCQEYRPEEVSNKEWARIKVGVTSTGLQVWCNRCDVNVLTFDSPEFLEEVKYVLGYIPINQPS